MYKYLELNNSNKNQNIKQDIINIINKQLANDTLNDNDLRKEYLEIKRTIDNNENINSTLLRAKIIKYEHCCEEATLNWKYSILIRMFK